MNVNRRRTSSIRGGSSVGGFLAFLAVAVVGGGLYVASRQAPNVKPRVTSDDRLVQVAALARAEKDAEWLQRAIRERHAILGMTAREVESAKGQPASKLRTSGLSADERAKGAVEKWVYPTEGRDAGSVLFGASGLVVYSSDVGDTPQPGQRVRQE